MSALLILTTLCTRDMLKKYVLSKLTSVFGKYVDGLDEQSLQVGVWSGEATN